MLAEARAEVVQADHKATLVLTVLGVGGGALLGGVLAGNWQPSYYDAPGEAFWWVGAVAGAMALLSAAVAVWPRWSTTDVSNGVFYWGHVATFATESDLAAVLDQQTSGDSDRTRHQLHRLSRIVARKYSLVRAAMLLAGLAGLLFIVAGITGS